MRTSAINRRTVERRCARASTLALASEHAGGGGGEDEGGDGGGSPVFEGPGERVRGLGVRGCGRHATPAPKDHCGGCCGGVEEKRRRRWGLWWRGDGCCYGCCCADTAGACKRARCECPVDAAKTLRLDTARERRPPSTLSNTASKARRERLLRACRREKGVHGPRSGPSLGHGASHWFMGASRKDGGRHVNPQHRAAATPQKKRLALTGGRWRWVAPRCVRCWGAMGRVLLQLGS